MKTLKNTVIKVSLIALIVLISSCNKYNHIYRESLKGDVKSVELKIFDANIYNGEIQKRNLRGKYIKTYDKKGYTTLFENYSDEKELRFSFSYNANDDRSIIEMSQKYRDTNIPKQIFRMKNNRPLSTKYYINDQFLGETTYYTENNKIFVGISKDTNGKFTSRVIEEYQNSNLVTLISFIDEIGGIYCTYYDKNSYKIAKILDKDKSGERILELIYNDSGFIEKSINGSYDEIAGSYYDGSSKNFNYKYQLDNKKNWIKCIVYEEESNKPVLIKERTITYY